MKDLFYNQNLENDLPLVDLLMNFSFFLLIIRAIEETNKAMERELDNLKYENERLSTENDKLENSVDR